MSNGKRIVVALGGNALGYDPFEQREACRQTARDLADLIEAGYELVISHGNGPQVGLIKLAFEGSDMSKMPLPECGAMSQGYIGFHLQNALREELCRRGQSKEVISLVTQVEVSAADPAFQKPTKPIGAFYSQEEAERLKSEMGYSMVEDAGRGYRRVVASPRPVDIVEKKVIRSLVEAGEVVIACGGGGIPVLREGDHLEATAAVIDKDFASALLAEQLEADLLIILTAVEQVAIRFGKSDQENLARLSGAEAERYLAAGEFGKGSMEPKVRAALQFARSGSGREALITSLEKARDGINGLTGTRIYA